jgi:uncharacterized protein YdbL (DUF1318 family)
VAHPLNRYDTLSLLAGRLYDILCNLVIISETEHLVKDINQKRRQTYEDIAHRNTTSLQAVEMLAGKTAIENTKPGNFIQLPSGQWVKK